MANTITNIKMTNPIRGLVSKRRKRYTQDGFNLDLTYIGDNIIAMGFPAEKLEAVYRNRMDEVVRFLESKHPDSYKIYNLCSERSYDVNKFKRAASYPFADHNPPNIELIQSFCGDVHEWLSQDSKNVAAVHCKAGKGRTGTMICCYMLYSGQFATAADALNYYGQQRTHDKKGVTIPSQRRYVEYYSQLLKIEKPYKRVCLNILEIKLKPPPFVTSHQGTVNFSISDIGGHKLHCAPVSEFKRPHQDGYILIRLDDDLCVPLSGDIKLEFSCKTMMRKEKLFHFWFNTYFVNETAKVHSDGNLILTLNKCDIDDAHKDKQHKLYPQDFKVEVVLQRIPESRYTNNVRLIRTELYSHHQTQRQMIIRNNSSSNKITNHLNNLQTNHLSTHLNNNCGSDKINNLQQQQQQQHLHHHHHNQNNQQPHQQNNTGAVTTTPLDAHTPSESSEASSSESSTEEDGWESGEFVTVPHNHHKLYYPNDDNYYYGSCISSSSTCSNNNFNNQNEMLPNNNSKQLTNSSSKILTTPLASLSLHPQKRTTTSTTHSSLHNYHQYSYSPSNNIDTNSCAIQRNNKPKQFKAKSNNINHFGSNSNSLASPNRAKNSKIKSHKLRWLTNMRSDPDLKATLSKSVKIRPSNAITIASSPNVEPTIKLGRTNSNDNFLSSDYYSSLCDKQLSFESPRKSPGDLMRFKKLPKQIEEVTSIVVAKQIEEKSKIGFNVDRSKKSACDKISNELNDKVDGSSGSSSSVHIKNNNSKKIESNTPSTSSFVEIMPDSKNQGFCDRILSHFGNTKKISETNQSHDNVIEDSYANSMEGANINNNNSNNLTACLSPVVPRTNRCTPFLSLSEIRHELQSVMKSQNHQIKSNQKQN